jgi:isoquinoline 1-oxidoreductase alpha subunit
VIEFQVNGQTITSESEADTPLLWVIRDELKLKGTKFGCGIAMCGACTVHIDGVATRSCITQVGTVAGKSITTIEGLDSDEGAGFLSNTPNPTDEQITEAMNGNLCRCMAYTRIHKAIKSAAGGEEA